MSNNPIEQTPRVEACIAAVEAKHPHTGKAGMASYFEAVHQALAPLARELERELIACRAQQVPQVQMDWPNESGEWWLLDEGGTILRMVITTPVCIDVKVAEKGILVQYGCYDAYIEKLFGSMNGALFIRATPPTFEVQS